MSDDTKALEKVSPAESEALTIMGNYEDDVVFGRMSFASSLDISEFDMLRPHSLNITADEMEDITAIEGEFRAPPRDPFPVFRGALRKFEAMERKPRVVRVDTPDTFDGLVADSAVRELERRLNELRAAVEAHAGDHHGGHMPPLRRWDVIGAAQAVRRIRVAGTADEAVDAMEQIRLELPPWARGKVKCWRDGDNVVCSIKFRAGNGQPRVATAAARPRVDVDAVAAAVDAGGVSPSYVFGALPALADAACARRLVRDTARTAMQARERQDICGMQGPVIVASNPVPGGAPLAALMHLMQECEKGDPQACRELAIIKRASQTPEGQKIGAPMLAEAQRRLAAARTKPGILSRFVGWLRGA